MWPAFEQHLKKYQELEVLLGDPAVIGDRARFARTAKEHGSLAKLVKPYLDYQKLSGEISENEALAAAEGDAAMRGYLAGVVAEAAPAGVLFDLTGLEYPWGDGICLLTIPLRVGPHKFIPFCLVASEPTATNLAPAGQQLRQRPRRRKAPQATRQ